MNSSSIQVSMSDISLPPNSSFNMDGAGSVAHSLSRTAPVSSNVPHVSQLASTQLSSLAAPTRAALHSAAPVATPRAGAATNEIGRAFLFMKYSTVGNIVDPTGYYQQLDKPVEYQATDKEGEKRTYRFVSKAINAIGLECLRTDPISGSISDVIKAVTTFMESYEGFVALSGMGSKHVIEISPTVIARKEKLKTLKGLDPQIIKHISDYLTKEKLAFLAKQTITANIEIVFDGTDLAKGWPNPIDSNPGTFIITERVLSIDRSFESFEFNYLNTGIFLEEFARRTGYASSSDTRFSPTASESTDSKEEMKEAVKEKRETKK